MSPAHAWHRVFKLACCYGGEFNAQWYAKQKDNAEAIAAIATLQGYGVKFTLPVAYNWVFELCGTFEVTHPSYQSPAHVESAAADTLFAFFCTEFGYVRDPITGEWNEAAN